MERLRGVIKTDKMRIFSATMCLCVIGFAFINAISLLSNSPDFLFAYSCGAVILAAVFCCLMWLVNIKKINTTTALIISATVLATCYLFLFPPITVPDEQAHYLSAYRLSNYILFDFSANQDNGILMRECDVRLFSTLLPNVNGQYIREIYKEASLIATDTEKTFYECGFLVTAPFSYILSAFGIAVARFFKLSALATFFVGRIMNIAGFTLLLIYAVKKIPYGKNVLPMIAALPITLHLSASFSYDSITLGFAFVFISQVLYIREKNDVSTWNDTLILTVFAILLAPSKVVYAPLILLVFIIPNNKFGIGSRKALLLKIAVVIIAALVFLSIQLSSVTLLSTERTSGWSEEPPYSTGWALTHPFALCKMLFNTLWTFAYFYFKNLFGGLLGWLNVNVPIYLWIPQMALVVFSCIRYKNEETTFVIGEKMLIWMCLIASSGMIMLSMLVTCTPVGSVIIYGVQGRYFLPLLLPLILVLRCKRFAVRGQMEKYISVLYMTFGFLTVTKLFLIVTA